MNEQRLERIEIKLDSVAEALVALARLDEKTTSLYRRLDTLDDQQTQQSNRLVTLEGSVGSNGASLRFAERLFWIVLAAVVTFAFKGGL